jgi:hypothetical protein
MRTIATVLFVLLGFGSITGPVRAEQSDSCKQCREQQQACAKNYAGMRERPARPSTISV